MHVIPITLERPFIVSSQILAGLPGPLVLGMGLQGHFGDDELNEPAQLIAYEWPMLATAQMTKRDMEWAHILRFQLDHIVGTGRRLYSAIKRGGDPPDFVDLVGRRPYGIECVQFVNSERREVQGLFELVHRAIRRDTPSRFEKLAGQIVYMWFEKEGGIERPPKATDKDAFSEILDHLAAYIPNPDATVVESGRLPEQMPDLNIVRTRSGCSFYTVPLPSPIGTPFYQTYGFELGIAYTTTHARSTTLRQVSELVRRKDRLMGIHDLIITVGGPSTRGYIFQSEEVTGGLCVASDPGLNPTRQIRRVLMHFWSSGAIYQLLPEFGLASPLPVR